MRRSTLLLPLAVTLACTTVAPPVPPSAAVPPAVHGLTIAEEASILEMEDRRAYAPEAVSVFVNHANELHRQRIALALGRIGPLTFADANGNGVRDSGEHAAGVAELQKLSTDPSSTIRETVAFSLGEIADESAIDTLVTLAGDADSSVAGEAIEALSKYGAKLPLARYSAFLAESRPEGVRARAARYLFRFGTDDASALASPFLGSNSPVMRREAAYTFSRRAYAPARDALHLLLNDSDTLTRAYSAAALGRIASGDSARPLIAALGDVHPWVRTNAAVALFRIAAKDASFANVADVPRIIALSEDPDPGTRSASIDLLGVYAKTNDTARARLLEVARNGSRWERELAAASIARQFAATNPELIPSELTSWGKVRVLEATADTPYGAALRRRLATDSDALVRENVLGNIAEAQADASLDLIRAALKDEDVIVRANALELYGSAKGEASDVRLAALRAAETAERSQAQNDARMAAIRGIAAIEDAQREPFLRSLLADADPMIRKQAADLIESTLKLPRPQYTPLPASHSIAEYEAIAQWSRDPHTATIHMTRGNVELALLTQDAPLTSWSFATLARKKYFDGTTFMRVVPNFVVQSGDPRNDQNGGPGYSIRDEINMQKYTRGAVGMALSGPDTGGSQYFITHSPQPHLDGGYTIFARVYGGMSGVVDQIERGDRVDTIGIDEHPITASEDVAAAAATPLPTVIGKLTADELRKIIPEYSQREASYTPDADVVDMLAGALTPDDRIDVFLGTWCTDSEREVPRFLRIIDAVEQHSGKKVPVNFIAVDRAKSRPTELLAGKHVAKVATFVLVRGDSEIGRIEERPTSLLEDDLLVLASKAK